MVLKELREIYFFAKSTNTSIVFNNLKPGYSLEYHYPIYIRNELRDLFDSELGISPSRQTYYFLTISDSYIPVEYHYNISKISGGSRRIDIPIKLTLNLIIPFGR
ncbi:unnamed protein product [Debaryomyces tyrocola]|nr:unnamed protein product [Debaryomyces tyrocola]